MLTLLCSAQSCCSHYTFKAPDRTAPGSCDSGAGAGGPPAPDGGNASVRVLLLSAKVPRGRTGGRTSRCISASADKATKLPHLEVLSNVIVITAGPHLLIPAFNETSRCCHEGFLQSLMLIKGVISIEISIFSSRKSRFVRFFGAHIPHVVFSLSPCSLLTLGASYLALNSGSVRRPAAPVEEGLGGGRWAGWNEERQGNAETTPSPSLTPPLPRPAAPFPSLGQPALGGFLLPQPALVL